MNRRIRKKVIKTLTRDLLNRFGIDLTKIDEWGLDFSKKSAKTLRREIMKQVAFCMDNAYDRMYGH